MSANSQPRQKKTEYLVRIPKVDKKRFSILKFNESLNVKPQQWPTETIQLEREDNRRQGVNLTGDIAQDYGEGSEYGKAAREEARRKKFGRQSRKYEHDKQPWKLTIEQAISAEELERKSNANGGNAEEEAAMATTKTRRFRSMREVGAGEHADYWVFWKNAGNDLEAFKVDEWYQFLPAVTYKYLDAEQAEERFKERDKVFNQFALKAQIQKQLNDQEERQQQETMKKGTASLKIKDEASSDEEEGEGAEGGENGANRAEKKGKGPKNVKKKPAQAARDKKKQKVENSDDVAAYESDDGDDEGREYDYMSDSGSDTDRDELNVEQKVDEDLVGVADEKGLKGDLESDEDQEDEDEAEDKESDGKEAEEMGQQEQEEAVEKKTESRPKAVKNVEKIMSQKGSKIDFDDNNESSASDSDDDPDSGKVKSILFMQDKRKKQVGTSSASSTAPATAASSSSQQQRKRPAEEEVGDKGNEESKRAKLSQQSDGKESELISEAFIRELLEKRPHSTKQLLNKVSQRMQQQTGGGGGGDSGKSKKVVVQLAEILKKIQPYQFRKKNEESGKETLFFSMNRTA